jgi:hypothetical protein
MMLIGTMPVPKASKRVGRWIYSDGHSEVWVQNVYGTPQEYRDFALAGRRRVDTQAGHLTENVASPGVSLASVQWDIIGLEAAAEYLGIPVATFRKRRQRHPIEGEQTVGRSPVWTREMLDRYIGKVDA